MIRESEYFHFAGRKSTDFKGIINVSVAEGLFSENVVAPKTINEVFIPGRTDPYFMGVEEQPKTIQLRFGFRYGWDDQMIDEIVRWLNVDTYQPLWFEGNNDKVFHVIPVDGIEKIHNGIKEGYLELNMRCSSSRVSSHKMFSPVYKTNETDTIMIANKGHFSTFPEIWIEKVDEGDIEIYNTTNKNKLFQIKNVEVGEKLYIDCENEIIDTNKEKTYHYDNFNDNYLELVYGENFLKFSKNMEIRFRYRYIFS